MPPHRFRTATTPDEPTELAPDGSEVRRLVATERGSMAHFTFPAGRTTPAIRHRRVDEVWYVARGGADLWLSDDTGSTVVELRPGTAVSIPVGTTFQVAVADGDPLVVVGVTMPPWPAEGDADVVEGHWPPST